MTLPASNPSQRLEAAQLELADWLRRYDEFGWQSVEDPAETIRWLLSVLPDQNPRTERP